LLEVTQSEKTALSAMARKLVEAWRNLPLAVEGQGVPGEPFWMTQELADAPDLIEKTATLFQDIESCSQNITLADNHDGAEIPCVFDCEGRRLVGVFHRGSPDSRLAVLVVVGGPQYRIGSHRQFLLLARSLAKAGIPVFRFDYRGMGDSEGEHRGFEGIQDDISSAVDTLVKESPGVHEVVIWGLCDAATAASFYAPGDPRIAGLVLLNPWVRSKQGEAKALLKHYYLQRLFSKSFWQKVLRGKFKISEALDSLNNNVKNAAQDIPFNPGPDESSGQNLSVRLEQHLNRFTGRILFVLSENDLTAAEFRDAVKASKGLRKLVRQPQVQWQEIAGADHTFSRKSWRDQVVELSRQWITEW
jgi:exosortase A-associated hydrolase 1